MSRGPRARWVVGPIGVVVVLGCSGGVIPTRTGDTNRQACERYARHLNGLADCVGLVYDADNLCEGTELVAVDMVPTYDCLQTHIRCDGPRPVLEADQCQLPLVALEGTVAASEPMNAPGSLPEERDAAPGAPPGEAGGAR